jgi:hypothetical protein
VTSPLERAEGAVEDAREAAFRGHCLPNLDLLIRAVEARYEARLREAANFPDVDERARQVGHFLADVVAGWPNGSRVRIGPTEGIDAPADACQFHGPTGSPCDCGHGPTADCHPKESWS